MRALLDVNVLLALLDQAHVHHARARKWFLARALDGWASCPLTQNGFVRIISLLALAVSRGGCLATFDEAIPLSAVRGAGQEHLALV
jgi:predicted nucleic acid-binding protein